jgi:yeast amino acid transporter
MVSPGRDSLFYLVVNLYQRLWIHKDELDTENYRRFNRWPMTNEFSSYFAAIQPFPAYLGLISCIVIVFIFNSASMWNGNQLLLKGLSIYLGVRIL